MKRSDLSRLALILSALLLHSGCPSDRDTPNFQEDDDDDDDVVGDDDDAVGDDDDAVGDDDDDAVGDDDDDAVGDDDDATAGCPACVYEFAINFTTSAQVGECYWCWDLEDGTYDMGYGSGAVYLYYQGYYGAAWYLWYYAAQSGNTVDFWYDSYAYDYVFHQEGYWNITGGGSAMTGRSTTEETTSGEVTYRRVQQLAGVGN